MRRQDKILAGAHPRGTRVSGCVQDPGAEYCCLIYVEGGDPNNVADRVAFIEKTPRVRVKAAGRDGVDTPNAWRSGPKGAGGPGDAQAQGLYGYYGPSRRWCEHHLRRMGYVLLRRAKNEVFR